MERNYNFYNVPELLNSALDSQNSGYGMFEQQAVDYIVSRLSGTVLLEQQVGIESETVRSAIRADIKSAVINSHSSISAHQLTTEDSCYFYQPSSSSSSLSLLSGSRVLAKTNSSTLLSLSKLPLVKQLLTVRECSLSKLLELNSKSCLATIKTTLSQLDSLRKAGLVILDLDWLTVRLSCYGKTVLPKHGDSGFLSWLLHKSIGDNKLDGYVDEQLHRRIRPSLDYLGGDAVVGYAVRELVGEIVNSYKLEQTEVNGAGAGAGAVNHQHQLLEHEIINKIKSELISGSLELVTDFSKGTTSHSDLVNARVRLVTKIALSADDIRVLVLFYKAGFEEFNSLSLLHLIQDYLDKYEQAGFTTDVSKLLVTASQLSRLGLLVPAEDNYSLCLSQVAQLLVLKTVTSSGSSTLVTPSSFHSYPQSQSDKPPPYY